MKLKHLGLTALALIIAFTLASCGDSDDDDSPTGDRSERSISFTQITAPTTDAEKRAVRSSPSANVDGEAINIGYRNIMRSGDQPQGLGTARFGQIFQADGNPVQGADGSIRISNSNDFSSLLPVGDSLFMVSHFESRPAAMYLTELSQDSSTGLLNPVRTRNLDFSHVRGGFVHCAGSVTPWNTHLGSEEYPANMRVVDAEGSINSYYDAMGVYFNQGTQTVSLTTMSHYDYGYQVEVEVDSFESATVTKHYAMGRIAHELGYVMPNEKTAYMADDGTNGILLRFEADRARDLSAGTLYAAKWTQTGADNGGQATITWIELGRTSDAAGQALLDPNRAGGRIAFTDIFDGENPNADGTCPSQGFRAVNTGGYGIECLQLKSGMEQEAAILETRRYAGYLGATTEFRKMEGITLDPDTRVMYLAMSSVERGMEDSTTDRNNIGTNNDIRLPRNKCGTVYALELDENYVATSMDGLVSGRPIEGDDNNSCHLDGIANPDNVTYIPGYRTLIIGEDTGSGHQNDAIWSYNLDSSELTRIFTTPYGSETTSPYWYPNIGGFSYLMAVVQHPYGESDQDQSTGADAERGYTGYVGPFPATD